MFVNEHDNFRKTSMTDFGLRDIDTDAHVPQFFMVTKVPKERVNSKAAAFAKLPLEQRLDSTQWAHAQSADCKARQAQRHTEKKAKPRAQAKANDSKFVSISNQNK